MKFFDKFKKKSLNSVFEQLDKFNQGRSLAEEGLSYRALGNFENALSLFRTAQTDYGYFPAISLIGTTYSMMNDRPKAIDWFETAIERESVSPAFGKGFLVELYANLASLYHLEKRVDLASGINLRGLAIADEISEGPDRDVARGAIYRNIALLSCESGDARKADEFFRKRLEIFPYCEVSRLYLPEVRKSWYVPLNEQVPGSPFGGMVLVTVVNIFTAFSSSIQPKDVARVCDFFGIIDPFSTAGIDTIISSTAECLERGLYTNPRNSGERILANSLISAIALLKSNGFDLSLYPCPLDKESVEAVSRIISTFDALDVRLS